MKTNLKRFNSSQTKHNYSKTLVWLMFLIQFFGFFLLLINQSQTPSIEFIGLGLAFIILTLIINIFFPRWTQGDSLLIFIVNMIYSIGFIMITRINLYTGRSHVIWYLLAILVSCFVFLVLSKAMNLFKNKFFFYFTVTLITFIVTLVAGQVSGGAKNWIQIGNGLTIQLSEFAKIGFVFMIASFYGDYEKIKDYKYGEYYLNIATYLFIGLFFLQGELGTAMVFFAVFIFSMFVYERRYWLIAINFMLAFLGLFIAYQIFGHIRVRFKIWQDPWADYHGGGYQLIQGLFAIASGGLFGSGLGLGSPNLIPVASSDFIFAAVAEEMGVFMGISIILLFVILIYKGIKIALSNQDVFFSSLAFGISIIFASQALVMFGGVLKLIPLTGITTPFLSYGGSATLSSFILLAVIQFTSSKKKVRYEEQ